MHFYHHISGKKWAYVFYCNYFCDSVSSNKSSTEKKKNKLHKTSAFTLNILSIKAAGLHTMHTNNSTMRKPVPSHNAAPLCLSWKIYVCLWLSLSGTWWRYWLRHRFKHTRQAGIDAIHRELAGPEGKKISHWSRDKTGAPSLQHGSSAFTLFLLVKMVLCPKGIWIHPALEKQGAHWSL